MNDNDRRHLIEHTRVVEGEKAALQGYASGILALGCIAVLSGMLGYLCSSSGCAESDTQRNIWLVTAFFTLATVALFVRARTR